SKPCMVGAASTVGPYFWTKPCSTRLSLSPRVSEAMSSLRMPSEAGQPTWLHSRRIWLQPQMHIIWWPISVKRVAGSEVPRRVKTVAQRSEICRDLLRSLPRLAKDARHGAPGEDRDLLRSLPRLAKSARRGAPHFNVLPFKDELNKIDINLLWLPVRLAMCPGALSRTRGPGRARLEPAPAPCRSA